MREVSSGLVKPGFAAVKLLGLTVISFTGWRDFLCNPVAAFDCLDLSLLSKGRPQMITMLFQPKFFRMGGGGFGSFRIE